MIKDETPITPLELWCDKVLLEYDDALKEHDIVIHLPQTGEVSAIMRMARIKRAERQLVLATIRADAADFMLLMKKANPTGEIYLDIPDGGIKVRVKW